MYNDVVDLISDQYEDLREVYALKKEMGEKSPLELLKKKHQKKLNMVDVLKGVTNDLPED